MRLRIRPQKKVPPPLLLPLKHVLVGLFCYPHVTLFLLQQQARWTRALRIVVGFCILASLLLGLLVLPRLHRSSHEWAGWLQREVQSINITDGRLNWGRPQNLPYTTRHRGWRLDFTEPDVPFEPGELTGPEQYGVWITAEHVFVWWQSLEKVVYLTLFAPENGTEKGLLNMTSLIQDGMAVAGDDFHHEAQRLFLHAIPLVLLQKSFTVLFAVLSYTLLFTVVTVVLRNPLTGRRFAPIFTFHLFASIPPLIVATVYAGLNLPYLHFTTAFIVAFVLYLSIVFFRIRQAVQEAAGNSRKY